MSFTQVNSVNSILQVIKLNFRAIGKCRIDHDGFFFFPKSFIVSLVHGMREGSELVRRQPGGCREKLRLKANPSGVQRAPQRPLGCKGSQSYSRVSLLKRYSPSLA